MIAKQSSLAALYAAALMTTGMTVSPVADACTRFVYFGGDGQVVTARSMDWKMDVGTNLWAFPRAA